MTTILPEGALARLLRAGELVDVWVPDMTHEAMRDLVRARSCVKKDTKVAKQRIQSILLRTGKRYEKKCGLFATEYGSQINLFLSLPSK